MKQKNYFLRKLARYSKRYLDYYNGFTYDFDKNGERQLIKKLSKLDIKTIFDVGSNVGDWALVAHQYFPDAKIHAFELSSGTYKTLVECIGDNDNIILNDIGLSNANGVLTYKNYGTNSEVNSILTRSTYHDNHTLPTLVEARVEAGDNYCERNDITQIDLLKIDVEGAEHLVLEGFKKMLESKLIKVVQFEYGYVNGDSKFLMRDFFELFEQYGYRVAKIKTGAIKFSAWHYENNDFKSGPNYMAIRNDDEELLSILESD